MDDRRTRPLRTFDAGYQLEPATGDDLTATFYHSFGGLTMAAMTAGAIRACPDKAVHSAHT